MKSNSFIRFAQCLALSLLFPFLSTAQSSIGVQAGLNWSDPRNNFSEPYNSFPQGNYFLGITHRLPLCNRLANNTDVQFTQRGYFLKTPFEMSDARRGFRMGYIDLASNIEYTVFKNIGLQFGAYAAYKITESIQWNEGGKWSNSKLDFTSKGDIGLQAGISARFQRWTTFVRYTHGLTNINAVQFTDAVGNTIEAQKIFNRGIHIGLGYRIVNL